MTSENTEPDKNTAGHTDYFCPFCNQKLFRGKVSALNMVCSGCNKLVRIKDIEDKNSSSQHPEGF